VNLTVNASDAMPQGGKLTVETQRLNVDEAYAQERPPLRPGQYVQLVVTDTGHGNGRRHEARIFEPFFFFHDQGVGKGTGLVWLRFMAS